MIEHQVTHVYEPTNSTCSQAALSMLLSFFDVSISPEDIADRVPVSKDENGEDWGSINQQLATWSISQGFDVELHTADFQIIDLSWAGLPKAQLLERMEAAKEHRDVPALGRDFSKIYVQSYIDFVNAGGSFHIHPCMTTALLDELLAEGPLMLNVAMGVLHGHGRTTDVALRETVPDDLEGRIVNHSIVAYGKDNDGNYLIADSFVEPGRHVVEPERLLAAMTASQIECDNMIVKLAKR
jgi:hypothetical protein